MPFIPAKNIKCVSCGADKAIARKLCKPCYYRARNNGILDKFHKLGPNDVFHTKYEIIDDCWVWQGSKNGYGYGIIMINDKPIRAHRFAYELLVAPIPEGKIILHICDNPPCVNPSHLRVGTKLDNNRDAHTKGRRAKGEKSHLAKISDKDALMILNDTRKQCVIAKEYRIGQSQISRIKNGARWKHLG